MPKMELMIETNFYLDVMHDAQVLFSTILKLWSYEIMLPLFHLLTDDRKKYFLNLKLLLTDGCCMHALISLHELLFCLVSIMWEKCNYTYFEILHYNNKLFATMWTSREFQITKCRCDQNMSDRCGESTLKHVVQNKINVWKWVSNFHFLDPGFKIQRLIVWM